MGIDRWTQITYGVLLLLITVLAWYIIYDSLCIYHVWIKRYTPLEI